MFAIVCFSQVAMGGHMAKGEAFSPTPTDSLWKLIPRDLIEAIYLPTIEKLIVSLVHMTCINHFLMYSKHNISCFSLPDKAWVFG